jgi:hypothetical protein
MIEQTCLLSDLIAQGQIAIRIMFALKERDFVHVPTKRESGTNRLAHAALVECLHETERATTSTHEPRSMIEENDRRENGDDLPDESSYW